MGNSKEFTRLMNRLDDLEEKLAGLQYEAKEIRHELNLAVINGKLEKAVK
jgi:hypothetical protein